MKIVGKDCSNLHKSYTLDFGWLETRINTGFFDRVNTEWE